MKHFIYFDKDTIESLVAQSYGGIDTSVQNIHEQTQVDESDKTNRVKVDVNGSFNAIIKKLKVSVGGEHESGTRNSVNELLGEIHTKILHDSIFDILISDLDYNDKFNPHEKKVGSFIKDEEELQIIDIAYLESLFKEQSVMALYTKNEQDNTSKAAEEELKALSSDATISNHDKQKIQTQIKKKLKDDISKLDTSHEYLKKVIEATKALLPYNRMALSPKGYLIPLEDKCFRDNPNLLGLKYGGSFHYIGYVTNILEKNPKTENNNVFGELKKMANQFLLSILPTDANKIYVLHPLGIYFEP